MNGWTTPTLSRTRLEVPARPRPSLGKARSTVRETARKSASKGLNDEPPAWLDRPRPHPLSIGGRMPVAVVQEWAEGGNDTTNYDAIHEKLMAADTMPDGFLVHTAGATPDGGFRV